MSLDASYKKWDTFDDSSESEDDAAGSGGDEAAPPNAVEVLTEADLDRMAVACEIEAEARKVLHDMETTAFAFSGATRSFGEYFDTSMGYVDLEDLENGVLGDLRAGFYDDVKAYEWRGREAVAFLFYARTRAGIDCRLTLRCAPQVVKHTTQKRRLIQKVLKWAHRVATSAGGQSISGR